MENLVSSLSFWLAFVLSIGSLFFYIRLAFKSRRIRQNAENETYDFNLGVTSVSTGSQEQVFAYTLVAAGTSLSTAFVFFLTASSFYGWIIFLCPIMFSLGNYVMLKVYLKAEQNNYFKEETKVKSGMTGLVPYLGQVITGSKGVGLFLIVLSFLNLLMVLVLELFIGSEIISYLSNHTFHTPLSTPSNLSWIDFIIFIFSIILLLSYLFIGGFRAVVASDQYQMKIMKFTLTIVLISLVAKILISHFNINYSFLSVKATGVTLLGFLLNVILTNLLVPVCQESSWQRFRAFKQLNIDFKLSIKKSIINLLFLWFGLIAISFALVIVSKNAPLGKITDVLIALKSIDNMWYPLIIFPLFTASCLFAMYSTADTCVSALIYLIDYFYSLSNHQVKKFNLKFFHRLGMIFIVFCCILIYLFIHKFFNPTILQLVFSVFSNLIVMAPTIFLTAILKPCNNDQQQKTRTLLVFLSLTLGSLAYWGSSIYSMVKGEEYLWLSQLSILGGLVFALLPVLPLFIFKSERQ